MADAEWIAQLLRAWAGPAQSFVPPPEIRRLRDLTRYRVMVMHDRTRDAARIEKLLEDASIKLSSVASNIYRRSRPGRCWASLVAGNTDTGGDGGPGQVQAAPEDPGPGRGVDRATSTTITRCWCSSCLPRSMKPTRSWRASTLPWRPRWRPGRCSSSCCRPSPASGSAPRRRSSPRPVETCPGSPPLPRWPRGPGWLRGARVRRRRGPARRRHGDKWLCSTLVEAAHSVGRCRNNYLASQYARIAGRRGSGRAAMAVAHSLLVISYHVLDRREPYHELGPD